MFFILISWFSRGRCYFRVHFTKTKYLLSKLQTNLKSENLISTYLTIAMQCKHVMMYVSIMIDISAWRTRRLLNFLYL